MSGKRRPECISFNVAVTPDKRKKIEEQENEVAVLAPFNPFPTVCFERQKISKSSERHVTLLNPNKTGLQVALTRLPEASRGFEWSATEFDIPGESEAVLSIRWTPVEYGSWRNNIKIVNKKTNRCISDIILVTSTESAPKISQRCLRSSKDAKAGSKQPKQIGKVSGTGSAKVTISHASSSNKENVCQNVTYISSSKTIKQQLQGPSRIPKTPVATAISSPQTPVATAVSSARRTTYEVPTSCSSIRRSTYSLRPRQFLNIVELESEKRSFDKIASPILSKSFENAASQLVENAIGAFNNETNTESQSSSMPGTTFIVPQDQTSKPSPMPGTKFIVPEDETSYDHLRRATYEVFDPPVSAASKMFVSTPERSACRLSIESTTSSLNLYDSLEAESTENSTESKINIDFDQYNFDNISLSHSSPESNSVTLRPGKSNLTATKNADHKDTFSFLQHEPVKSHDVHQPSTSYGVRCRPEQSNLDVKNNSCLLDTSSDVRHELVEVRKIHLPFHSNVETFRIEESNLDETKTPDLEHIFSNLQFDLVKSPDTEKPPLRTTAAIKDEEVNLGVLNTAYQISIPLRVDSEQVQSTNLQPSPSVPVKREEEHYSESVDLNNTFTRIKCEVVSPPAQSPPDFVTCRVKLECPSFSDPPSEEPVHSAGAVSHQTFIWDISPPKKICREPEMVPEKKDVPVIKKTTKSKTSAFKQPRTDLLPNKNKVNFKETSTTRSSLGTSSKRLQVEPPSSTPSGSVFKAPKRPLSVHRLPPNTTPKLRKIQDVKVKRLSCTESTKKRLSVPEWVPTAVRRLRLSCTSTSSLTDDDRSTKAHSPVDPSVDPFLAATSLNPFQEGGLYFDQKWLDDQERELIRWTAHMLQPPVELELTRDQTDRSKLHRLTALREAAFNILISTEVRTALSKIKTAVEKKIISIRSDRQLHVDLGLQDKIIGLLMNYNPLWLRLCLEAIFQCTINLKRHSDAVGLTNFIRRRVVSDQYIQETCSHPTIPYFMLPEFEEKIKKFTLFKFLQIVYLLDYAKGKRLIRHNPCLFRKESPIKSSKDILIEFNRDFISGTGDLTRVLQKKGYVVTHSQTYLDEFDFTLTERSELRDGVRLTKLAEIVTGDNSYCSRLRVPAISSLQKKFNCELAFNALAKNGFNLPENICPKDLSDGHKEKTLSFIWHLKGSVQKHAVTIIIRKWREIKPVREARRHFLKVRESTIKIQRWFRKQKERKRLSPEEVKKAEEERERFLKLKSIVTLLQRKFRKKKETENQKRRSEAACKIQKWYRNRKATDKERKIFTVKLEAAIKIQCAYRKYKLKKAGMNCDERRHFINIRNAVLRMQFMFREKITKRRHAQREISALVIQKWFKATTLARQIRKEFLNIKSATILIQRRYRAIKLRNAEQSRFLKKREAAIKIQRWFRACKIWKRQRNDYLKLKAATIIIQRRYRAIRLLNSDKSMYLKKREAVIKIQRFFRACKIGQTQRNEYLKLKAATITIQRRYRAIRLLNADKSMYLKKREAVIKIQRFFRACKIGQTQRNEYLKLKAATITIQRRYRAIRLLNADKSMYLKKREAVIKIQRFFRACKIGQTQRNEYLQLKAATITIQRRYRAIRLLNADKSMYLKKREAVIKIQRFFRACKIGQTQRNEYLKLKAATITIQRRYRAIRLLNADKSMYLKKREAVIKIQRFFRACKIGQTQRNEYLKLKAATITIQRKYRAIRLLNADKSMYLKKREAVIKIQRFFRACKIGQTQRNEYLQLKAATITIQRRYRAIRLLNADKSMYLKKREAVIKIQRFFRACKIGQTQRNEYLQLKAATITIQRRYRAIRLLNADKSMYLKKREAVINIQRFFRACKIGQTQRNEYLKLKAATITIQRKYRAIRLLNADKSMYLKKREAVINIQRFFRACKIGQTQRNEYLKLKAATITIQRRYRAIRLLNSDKSMYLKKREAVINIQRFFRACKIGQTQRNEYLKLKAATIVIQRKYRAIRLLNADKSMYLKKREAVIKIQRFFRACKIGQTQRNEYLKLKATTIVIQRWYRAVKLLNNDKNMYLKKREASIKIQKWYRSCKIGQIQRRDSLKLRTETLQNQEQLALQQSNDQSTLLAATKIQAWWRGLLVRRAITVPKPKVKEVPELTEPIETRARRILPYITDWSKCSVFEMQMFLYNLDTVTLLSADQCSFFVGKGIVKVLYNILSASNRAVGVDKCIERALLSLGNLYRSPDTATTVWQETREVKGVSLLIDLMLTFKTAKSPAIFCNAATVLWLFGKDQEKATEIRNTPKAVQTINYIGKDLKKHYKTPATAAAASRKKTKPSEAVKLPSIAPNWGNYFDTPRAFTDRMLAFNSVCNCLQIQH